MGKGQATELELHSLTVVGTSTESYPLQKKGHSMEFLRSIPQFRSRGNSFGAVLRIRNALTFAIHKFFQQEGFIQVHTPILTKLDCEGAGEMFNVSHTADAEQSKVSHFFGDNIYLTVSGQLHSEIFSSSMTKVYTFNPAFRAENSHTSRHLAEFWMLEPEMSWCEMKDNINLARNCLKFVVKDLLAVAAEDLQFFEKFVDRSLISRLNGIVDTAYEEIPYTEAIRILNKVVSKGDEIRLV